MLQKTEHTNFSDLVMQFHPYLPQLFITLIGVVLLLLGSSRSLRSSSRKIIGLIFHINTPLKYPILRMLWFATFPLTCIVIFLTSLMILAKLHLPHNLLDSSIVILGVYVLLRSISIFAGYTKKSITLWIAMVCLSIQEFHFKEPIKQSMSNLVFGVMGAKIYFYDIIATFVTALTLFWFVAMTLRAGQRTIIAISPEDRDKGELRYKIFSYIVYIVAIVALLTIIGVQSSHIAMFSSAIGVGIGFGLQKIAANFISSIMLLFEKTVEVGDILELSGGQIGMVKSLGLRALIVTTFDGKDLIIPSEQLTNQVTTNYTLVDNKIRLSANFHIVNKKDIKKSLELMRRACTMQKGIYRQNPIICCVRDINERGIHLMSFFWINDFAQDDILNIKSSVIARTVGLMEEHDIDLYFEKSLGIIKDTLHRISSVNKLESSPFVNRLRNKAIDSSSKDTLAGEGGDLPVSHYSD